MIETTITQQQMESVKVLAETNMQISEAKNLLFAVKKEEQTYILKREREVSERIDALYLTSKQTLDDIKENYEGVKTLLILSQEATSHLKETYGELATYITESDENSKKWQEIIKVKEEDFINLKKGLDIERTLIENDKKAIKTIQASLDIDRRKIADDRGTLERAFNRLKQ